MFDIHVLGSSSKGNCIYVNCGDCSLLLDAGLSLKVTKAKLHEVGVKLSDIDCIMITHEHGDHIKGIPTITKTCFPTIIASKGTLKEVNTNNSDVIFMQDKDVINFHNIKVSSKKVLHDANEPLCFSIENSLGEKLLYLTDCGNARTIRFKNHDIYIIEANYSRAILEKNFESGALHEVRYKRTNSGMGHLEIGQTIAFLEKNIGNKTKQIILSHLSSDNSNGDEFKERVSSELFFFNVDIAKEGFHINCGEDPQPF